MKLSELIKDNYAYFDSYRAGFFYYHIKYDTGVKVSKPVRINHEYVRENVVHTYQFTIPREDFEGATLNAKEKAITLTKWIRQAMERGELIKVK